MPRATATQRSLWFRLVHRSVAMTMYCFVSSQIQHFVGINTESRRLKTIVVYYFSVEAVEWPKIKVKGIELCKTTSTWTTSTKLLLANAACSSESSTSTSLSQDSPLSTGSLLTKRYIRAVYLAASVEYDFQATRWWIDHPTLL
jgi:hypothetical protein